MHPTHSALALTWQIVRPEPPMTTYYTSSNACLACASIMVPGAASHCDEFGVKQREQEQAQAHLLRCIFGVKPVVPYATDLHLSHTDDDFSGF
ncbi:MAG: hypothetical protein ACFCD0_00690 [Gemmataceae bacterium]